MPYYSKPTDTDQLPRFFSDSLKQIRLPRHFGYAFAGALVFAGATTALSVTSSSSTPELNNPKQTLQSTQSPATPPPTQLTPEDTSSQASPVNTPISGTNQDVHVNVNGKDIPVPANGSTEQTITSADGTNRTTVNATSNTEVNGYASNSSSTTFNLQITSNSSSTGGSSSP